MQSRWKVGRTCCARVEKGGRRRKLNENMEALIVVVTCFRLLMFLQCRCLDARLLLGWNTLSRTTRRTARRRSQVQRKILPLQNLDYRRQRESACAERLPPCRGLPPCLVHGLRWRACCTTGRSARRPRTYVILLKRDAVRVWLLKF